VRLTSRAELRSSQTPDAANYSIRVSFMAENFSGTQSIIFGIGTTPFVSQTFLILG
jgi:hypothetical protein